MKNIILSIIALVLLQGCSKYIQSATTSNCSDTSTSNNSNFKKDTIEKLIRQYANLGVPGLVVAIESPEGYWSTSAGLSKIETNQPMETCHLQYLQSISKTYMAVAILKLYEEGRIELDSPITKWLPTRFSSCLDRPESITVRNLLNHESGVPEYSDVPEYIVFLLQHPDHSFTTEEFLGYIKGKKQQFKPGSHYEYTNTNYHLLALIADSIAGDHAKLISETIFKPLGLTHTFYRANEGYLNYPELPNSYLDRFSNGILENVTMMQRVSVACSKGDDGIVCTPHDAIAFLKGLNEGKLLSPTTLAQMNNWVNNEKGEPVYGMGLFHVSHNGYNGYGHGGAGIGAGCGLYYFPGKKLYIFLATNIGTLIDGPTVDKVEELKGKILEIALSNG